MISATQFDGLCMPKFNVKLGIDSRFIQIGKILWHSYLPLTVIKNIKGGNEECKFIYKITTMTYLCFD